MDETWTSQDLPVLRAIVEAFDDPDRNKMSIEEIRVASGMESETVLRPLRRLSEADPPYIKGVSTSGASYPVAILGVTERARVAAGQWPSANDFVDRLIAALEEAAEGADEEERSRLRRIAAGLRGAGRDVFVGVVASLLTKGWPGSS